MPKVRNKKTAVILSESPRRRVEGPAFVLTSQPEVEAGNASAKTLITARARA